MSQPDTKYCCKCEQTKLFTDFYKDTSKKDKVTSYCIPCCKEKRQKKYTANLQEEKQKLKNYYKKNKEKAKEYYLSKTYGLEKQEYERMFEEQEGKCAICGTHHSRLNRGLFVDHCHSSEQVRGLLCQFCNTLLGMAQDDSKILQKAIKYLEKA